MAYFDIAQLTQDLDFTMRVAACYATESLDTEGAQNPNAWASNHIWPMAAQPGFGDAYAYAIANGNPAPGRDPAVLTDGMILTAVQSLMTGEEPVEEGNPDA